MNHRRQLPVVGRATGLLVSALSLVAALLPLAKVGAQDLPRVSTEVRLSDFRISEPNEILRGRVSIAYLDEGPRLSLYLLEDDPLPDPSLSEGNASAPVGSGCFDLEIERGAATNALGGRFGAFAYGGPSAVADIRVGEDDRQALVLECDGAGGGCGLWLHLFESGNRWERRYLDASRLGTLSFWVRQAGGESPLLLRLADAHWVRRDGSMEFGEVRDFERSEGPAGWTRVEFPLGRLNGVLAADSLGSVVLEATDPDGTEVHLAGMELCMPGGTPRPVPPPLPHPSEVDHGDRALWVWNTRELIANRAERAEFLDFVEAGRFSPVFLQLVPAEGRRPQSGYVPFDGEAMGALVADLGARGAEVYALDGDPRYAFPEHHEGVLRTVDSVVAHNRRVPEDQRFHGVRYDVEPYILPEFKDERRATLLRNYLELVDSISRLARRGGLAVGVDVPFWLDGFDAVTGQRFSAELGGETAPILHHLMELVDDIAIMDYRTNALGVDGIVAHALDELDAGLRGGTRVFVGLETEDLADADVLDFEGRPSRGFPPEGGDEVWVVLDVNVEPPRIELVPSDEVRDLRRSVRRAGGSADGLYYWRSRPPVRVLADRQSFHNLGLSRMEEEIRNALGNLATHPAFAGIAYHHYGTLKELAEQNGGRIPGLY